VSENRAEMVCDTVNDGNCPLCRKRGIVTKLTQTSLGDVCEQGECGYVDGWDFGPRPKKESPVSIAEIVEEVRKQYNNLVDALDSEGLCTSRECMCDTSAPIVKLGAAITRLEQSEAIPAQERVETKTSS
jgi:hypothetical protein